MSQTSDSVDREPCAACGELINPEATVCPECDNNPAAKAKWSSIGLMIAGFAISLTGIGAVIGIPMFLIGLVARIGMYWTDYPAVKYGWG